MYRHPATVVTYTPADEEDAQVRCQPSPPLKLPAQLPAQCQQKLAASAIPPHIAAARLISRILTFVAVACLPACLLTRLPARLPMPAWSSRPPPARPSPSAPSQSSRASPPRCVGARGGEGGGGGDGGACGGLVDQGESRARRGRHKGDSAGPARASASLPGRLAPSHLFSSPEHPPHHPLPCHRPWSGAAT